MGITVCAISGNQYCTGEALKVPKHHHPPKVILKHPEGVSHMQTWASETSKRWVATFESIEIESIHGKAYTSLVLKNLIIIRYRRKRGGYKPRGGLGGINCREFFSHLIYRLSIERVRQRCYYGTTIPHLLQTVKHGPVLNHHLPTYTIILLKALKLTRRIIF